MPDFRAVGRPPVWCSNWQAQQNAAFRMMVANLANGAAQAPPTMVITAPAPPPLQSPPALSALQPSPTERLNASSTSPTNTSGSDGSAVSGLDIAALIAASQTKPDFQAVQQDPPIPNPLLSMPDASIILQFFQSQQAAMLQVSPGVLEGVRWQQQLQVAAQRAAVAQQQQAQQEQQRQQQQQQHSQQTQQTERKRSYPCTFQFCVLCQKDVHSSKLPCHIRQCHVAKPMFQCPACDFTSTYSKNNVKSHMVSLHGLAGDPISYMERYAPQVEEFMRMCFPNVRGRGRPMQGRGSPRSPASPQNAANRRQSQNIPRRPSFARENELLVQAAQQQQLQQVQAQAQAALIAQAQSQLQTQLSIFPQLFNNNNSSVLNQNGGMKTPMKTEPMEQEPAAVSSGSSFDDVQGPLANYSSRQMSIISTGSLRSLTQTVRPGENWQPRYNTLLFRWSVLNADQVKETIFSGLPDSFEKIDSLDFGAGSNDTLLKPEQEAKIQTVRGLLQIQTYEILFAIHRMDHSALKSPEKLDLLISVAPSPVDSQKIRDWMESHPNANFNEEEQFVTTLAQVKHLEEKLCIMRHMACFDRDLAAVTEQLRMLSSASKTLSGSEAFKGLILLVLAAQNQLFSASTQPIRGFIVSQLDDVCQYKLPSGDSLLSVVASLIRESHSEIAVVFDLVPLLENASKTPFTAVLAGISKLEENNTRADVEVKETFNNLVAAFLENSQSRLNSVNELALNVKEELLSLMAFMAEPLPRAQDIFSPESFFRRVAAFLRSLRDEMSS